MKDGFNSERNEDRLWPWVFGAVILLGAGGIAFYLMRDSTPDIEPALDAPVATIDAPAAPPPAVVDTAPPPARTLPLPPLDESDADVLGGLTEIFGQGAVAQHVIPERIVRNIVVTICLLYTSPSPRDGLLSRMPSSA